MIAVLWSELHGWGARRGGLTLCALLCFLAVPGALTNMRPDLQFTIMAAAFVSLGTAAGVNCWSRIGARDWMRSAGTPPLAVVAGRTLAAMGMAAAHVCAVMPVIIVTAIIWGLPFQVIAGTMLLLLLSAGTAANLGLAASQLKTSPESFLEGTFIITWLLLTALLPDLRLLNPLCQAWTTAMQGFAAPAVLFLANLLLNLGTALLALLVLCLGVRTSS